MTTLNAKRKKDFLGKAVEASVDSVHWSFMGEKINEALGERI